MSATLSATTLLAVPLAPLAGALLAGVLGTALGGNVIGRRLTHTLTILGVFTAFVISVMTLQSVVRDGASFSQTLYTWMNVGGLKMEVGFLVDGLTAMMMCVVTFVSLMVHLYTIGYMEEDAGYNRFFCLHLAVHLFDVDAGDEQQLATVVLRLGGCGLGVVFADWVLVQQTHGDFCQHEGLFSEPCG